jgi:serpin B
MKQTVFLLSLAFCLALFSCESKNIDNRETPEISEVSDSIKTDGPKYISDPILINLTRNELQMAKDNTDFAMKFFSAIYDNSEEKENIVVSPFSMSMALAVLRNGAEGETKEAIQKTMGMKDFSESEINACFRKLKDALTATDPSLSLAIANSIWYKKDAFIIKKKFENLSKTWYDAPITGLDYSNMKAAVETVNKWCSDNTNEFIKDMFKDLKDVEILNALYFKGCWNKDCEFDASKTTKEEFVKSDGQKVMADMMHNNIETQYYKDDYLSFAKIPYGNTAYSIYFVLPDNSKTFKEMMEQLLIAEYWSKCVNATTRKVDLSIPKFEVMYENEKLDKVFGQLGMGIAFSQEKAQFPHIAENTNFYVARSQTKSYLKVDEKGSEAASVHEFGMNETSNFDDIPVSGPAIFRVDRPFLFMIRESSTGTILFMGKIGDPTEK